MYSRNKFRKALISSSKEKTSKNINPYFKEETLFANEYHKEILLFLIKNKINLLLKSNQDCNSKRTKTTLFKELLSDLKLNLTYMLHEKTIKEKYLKDKMYITKNVIQNKIFNLNQKVSYINREEENKANIEIDVLERVYGGDELSKIKMMNFKVENEIKKYDFLMRNKNYVNNYIKATSIYPNEKSELFYDFQRQNSNEIDNSFSFQIKEVKDYLNNLAIKKYRQNSEIERLKKNIDIIRYNNEIENIISRSDIIYEDSEENRYITNKENISTNINVEDNNNCNLNLNEKEIIISQKNEIINKIIRNTFNEYITNKFILKMVNKEESPSKKNKFDREKKAEFILIN